MRPTRSGSSPTVLITPICRCLESQHPAPGPLDHVRHGIPTSLLHGAEPVTRSHGHQDRRLPQRLGIYDNLYPPPEVRIFFAETALAEPILKPFG